MQIGSTDDFEQQYMAKFRAIASTYGIFVEYSIDRAARDIGTKEYQREMNTVGQWVEAMCEKSTIGTKLYLSEIREKYAKWATAEHGWAASKQKLAEELRARGYEEDHPRNLTRFKLRLRPEKPDDAG